MKKSVSLLITALMLCTALSVPVFAAEETAPGKDSCYYPISVEEYTYGPLDELRIDKVYQLSLNDDPGGIPTEDGYTGTTSSKYATGYTVSANYTGEVAKTGCDVVTYTAATSDNRITLYTCLRDERDFRWKVTALEQ